MKRLIGLGLALVLSVGLVGPALAADGRAWEPDGVVTKPVVTDPVLDAYSVVTDPVPLSTWWNYRPPDPPIEDVETTGSGLTGTYVGLPGKVRYLPAFQYQLVYSDPQGGYNCTAYAAAMAVDKATYGGAGVTGRAIRALSGAAPYNGLSLQNAVVATDRLYVPVAIQSGTWSDLLDALRRGRGVILQGDYDQIPDSYSGQPAFDGNHAVYIDYLHSSGNYLYVMDPLQSRGARWVPVTIMQKFAEKLARSQGIYPRVFYAVIRPTRFFQ